MMMMQQRLMELRQASGMNDEEFEELERQVEEELLEAPPTTDETERAELEEPHTLREVKKGVIVPTNNVSPKSQSTKMSSSKKRSPTSPRRRPVQQNRFEEIPDHVRMEI
jgi:hypothetical protein